MQNMRQQDQDKITVGGAFGLIYLLCNAHRMLITVFIRHSFGVNAFQPHGLATIVFMLIAAAWRRVFWGYFIVWFIALAAQRIQSFWLRWKGVSCHSQYQGYPWLAMWWPGVKSEADARRAEPFICLFGGLVLVTVNESLGLLVIAGFVTFAVIMGIDAMVDRRRVQVMQDAELEMRYYVERYRGRT